MEALLLNGVLSFYERGRYEFFSFDRDTALLAYFNRDVCNVYRRAKTANMTHLLLLQKVMDLHHYD